MLGKSPISWKSKKQSVVSRSSSEAEYRAMSATAAEVTWMVRLLEELGVKDLKPITLHCDNQSAIHIAKNHVHHERTKHIEIDVHFTRDKVMEGLLQISYLPTELQIADLFTKILPSAHFKDLLSKLGMIKMMPSLREDVENNKQEVHKSYSAHEGQNNKAQEDSCNRTAGLATSSLEGI